MTGSDDLALELVRAIAVVEGVEPHELDFSLHDYVATDAIRSMADQEGRRWQITFEVPGHVVTVDDTGEIKIDGDAVRRSDAVQSEESR